MACQFCASLDRLLQSTHPPVKTEIEIIVRLPSNTPLINWGVAMDRLTQDLGGGEWWYRMPPNKPGRYEVEVRS
ncbi:MAG: hypothetical protein ABTQ93_15390 [Candidatus Competibacter denitrificans]